MLLPLHSAKSVGTVGSGSRGNVDFGTLLLAAGSRSFFRGCFFFPEKKHITIGIAQLVKVR